MPMLSFIEGAVCVMTPTDKTNRLAREKIKQFWTQLGSSVKLMTPQERMTRSWPISVICRILAAFALMKSIPDNFLEHATQGVKRYHSDRGLRPPGLEGHRINQSQAHP